MRTSDLLKVGTIMVTDGIFSAKSNSCLFRIVIVDECIVEPIMIPQLLQAEHVTEIHTVIVRARIRFLPQLHFSGDQISDVSDFAYAAPSDWGTCPSYSRIRSMSNGAFSDFDF